MNWSHADVVRAIAIRAGVGMSAQADFDREAELREWHAGKEILVRPGSDIGLLLMLLDEARAAKIKRDGLGEYVDAPKVPVTLDARARSLILVNQYASLFVGDSGRDEVRAAIQQHIELAVTSVASVPNMTHYSRDELLGMRARLCGGGDLLPRPADLQVFVAINEELVRRGDAG